MSKKSSGLEPILQAVGIFIAAQALTLFIVFPEREYVETNQIASPQVSAGFPLLYFFAVVVAMGLVLYFIPLSKLKLVLKALFGFLFAWGAFVVLYLVLPWWAAVAVAAIAGFTWLFRPRVWLHNALLILALVSTAAVFGYTLAPWAVMAVMLVLSVYDVVAVRSGYMLWMAKKMSQSESLPVFLIPKRMATWNLSMKKSGVANLVESEAGEREFSILGGGDIGFPLILVVNVFFNHGFAGSVVVAGFSLIGLVSAYLIQIFFLKGKPMPALPPITALSLAGFLIASSL